MRRKEKLWIYVDLPEPSVNVHCVVKSLGYMHATKKVLRIRRNKFKLHLNSSKRAGKGEGGVGKPWKNNFGRLWFFVWLNVNIVIRC